MNPIIKLIGRIQKIKARDKTRLKIVQEQCDLFQDTGEQGMLPL